MRPSLMAAMILACLLLVLPFPRWEEPPEIPGGPPVRVEQGIAQNLAAGGRKRGAGR